MTGSAPYRIRRFITLMLLTAAMTGGFASDLPADQRGFLDELKDIIESDGSNTNVETPIKGEEDSPYLDLTIIDFGEQSAFRIEIIPEKQLPDNLKRARINWAGGGTTVPISVGSFSGSYSSRIIHLRPLGGEPVSSGATVYLPPGTTSVTVEIGGMTEQIAVDLSKFAAVTKTPENTETGFRLRFVHKIGGHFVRLREPVVYGAPFFLEALIENPEQDRYSYDVKVSWADEEGEFVRVDRSDDNPKLFRSKPIYLERLK